MDEVNSAVLIGTVVHEVPTVLYRFYDLARRLLYVGGFR